MSDAPIIEGEVREVVEVVENAISRSAPTDMDASLAVQLTAAEIDQQIATARKWPRQIDSAVKAIVQLATYDPETAQECIYNLPRGRGSDAKVISGPSIRMAELIAQQWGNNRSDARVVHVDRREKYIEAEGVYHDLETNTAVRAKVRRRISDSRGKLYNDDMIIVTGNAACSIALRNAILRGVPKPIWRRAYEKAVAVVRGDERTLQTRRAQLLDSFEGLGIPAAQVYAIAGVGGPHDVGLDQLVYLAGIFTAIKNNEATAEDLLQERTAATPQQSAPKGLGAGFGDEGAKTGDPAGSGAAEPKPTTPAKAAGPKKAAAADAQEQVKADRRAALDKAVTLGEEAEEAAMNDDGTLEAFLERAETEEEQGYVRNGWARGTAEREGRIAAEGEAGAADGADGVTTGPAATENAVAETEGGPNFDDSGAEGDDGDDDEDGPAEAAPGEKYLLAGEAANNLGRLNLYRDGKVFSTVTEDGAKKFRTVDYHPGGPVEEKPAEPAKRQTRAELAKAMGETAKTQAPAEDAAPGPDADAGDQGGQDAGAAVEGDAGESTQSPASSSDSPPPSEDTDQSGNAGDAASGDGTSAFDAFDLVRDEAESWGDILQGLHALSVTEDWRGADPEAKRMTRMDAAEKYLELVAAGAPEVSMTVDLQLFRCWIELPSLTGPEIQKVWRDVIRSKAYGALDEASRDGLGGAVATRKDADGGAT